MDDGVRGSFALVVVLFILLIIVGSSYKGGGETMNPKVNSSCISVQEVRFKKCHAICTCIVLLVVLFLLFKQKKGDPLDIK